MSAVIRARRPPFLDSFLSVLSPHEYKARHASASLVRTTNCWYLQSLTATTRTTHTLANKHIITLDLIMIKLVSKRTSTAYFYLYRSGSGNVKGGLSKMLPLRRVAVLLIVIDSRTIGLCPSYHALWAPSLSFSSFFKLFLEKNGLVPPPHCSHLVASHCL
jgi:hypothetical protein